MTIQNHHISKDPEITVKIYKGEHWILTQLQRRKKVSRGFIKALNIYVALNWYEAKELEKDDN